MMMIMVDVMIIIIIIIINKFTKIILIIHCQKLTISIIIKFSITKYVLQAIMTFASGVEII